MAQIVQVVVIFLSVLAVLFGIAAMATDEWITACIDMSSILKAAGAGGQAIPGLSSEVMGQVGQMTMCLTMGILMVGMNVANMMKTSVAMSFADKDAAFHVTSALIVIGAILLIIGIVFFSMATCNQSHSGKSRAYSRSRKGSCLILIGGTFFFVAMVVFSATQASTIHQPLQFLGVWGMGMAGGLKNGFPGMPSSGGAGSNPFESMFKGLGAGMGGDGMGTSMGGASMGGGSMDVGNMDLGKMFNGSFGGGTMGDDMGTGGFGGFNDGNSRKKRQVPNMGAGGISGMNALAMFQSMDPVFGYSYYIGWVGVALGLVAGILGMVFHAKSRAGDVFDRVPLA